VLDETIEVQAVDQNLIAFVEAARGDQGQVVPPRLGVPRFTVKLREKDEIPKVVPDQLGVGNPDAAETWIVEKDENGSCSTYVALLKQEEDKVSDAATRARLQWAISKALTWCNPRMWRLARQPLTRCDPDRGRRFCPRVRTKAKAKAKAKAKEIKSQASQSPCFSWRSNSRQSSPAF